MEETAFNLGVIFGVIFVAGVCGSISTSWQKQLSSKIDPWTKWRWSIACAVFILGWTWWHWEPIKRAAHKDFEKLMMARPR